MKRNYLAVMNKYFDKPMNEPLLTQHPIQAFFKELVTINILREYLNAVFVVPTKSLRQKQRCGAQQVRPYFNGRARTWTIRIFLETTLNSQLSVV